MTKEEYVVRAQLLGAEIIYDIHTLPHPPIESIYLGGEYTGVFSYSSDEDVCRGGVHYTYEEHIELLMILAGAVND